jgi:hypothetical protein
MKGEFDAVDHPKSSASRSPAKAQRAEGGKKVAIGGPNMPGRGDRDGAAVVESEILKNERGVAVPVPIPELSTARSGATV